jgi:hypothetical protein
MEAPWIEIENFTELITSTDFDIIHEAYIYPVEVISKSSIVYLNFKERKIKLKFDLENYSEIKDDNFLYVSETDILFYAGCNEWCAFDLKNLKKIRQEVDFDLPSFEKRENIIIVYGELTVESIDFNAERIDQVPVDPPYESIELEDCIEFDSSIFGKQILKIKKGKSSN